MQPLKILGIYLICTLRGEAFTCLRQFLTYCLGTISLAMMCCDLRLKSKTVLMFWDRFCPKGFGVLFQKRILLNKSVPIWDNKHEGLGQNLSQNIKTIFAIFDLSCCDNNSHYDLSENYCHSTISQKLSETSKCFAS